MSETCDDLPGTGFCLSSIPIYEIFEGKGILIPKGCVRAMDPPLKALFRQYYRLVRSRDALYSLRIDFFNRDAQLFDAIRKLRGKGFIDLGRYNEEA